MGNPLSLPTFGTRLPGVSYRRRPSAYAVIRNEKNEIALARTPQACFLPGGGIDPGETPEQTIEREGREECGFILQPGAFLGKAIEYCYSDEEAEYFEKHSTFFAADIVGFGASSEPDHETVWLHPDKAIQTLSHGSHRWAVQQLLESL
jgi:8-oxo-dGTP diphosphatase